MSPAQQRRPRPDPSRLVAYDLLRAVAERDAYANLALPQMLRERTLTGRDAAFATELAYGTLRGRGTYDAVIAACVDRPLDAVDPAVLDLLRLGSHQLLAMRVPAHAAVSATVELARAVAGPARSSFVNAVLRAVARQDKDAWVDQVAPPRGVDPVGYLSVAYSHPRWVVDAFADRLGSLDQTQALLAADNTAPEVTLVARPGRCTVDELLAAGGQPGRWSPHAVRWPAGDPADLPQVRSGAAGVQDEGSQLVAVAHAAAPVHGTDQRWLDLCAGPGGKAALLAGLLPAAGRHTAGSHTAGPDTIGDSGGALLAVDLQPHRAALVRGALAGPDAGAASRGWAVIADARAGPWQPASFDRVLADVPCTGLGALRRRPDARWRRRPGDVARLFPLQRDLLAAALAATRPGGVVTYATCSPHLGETEVVVGEVLTARPDVEVLDARPFLPGVDHLGPGPYVQLWPHVHGTDAMFVAVLRRTS